MGLRNQKFMQKLYHFERVEVPSKFVKRNVDAMIYLYHRVREKTPSQSGHAKLNWRLSSRAYHRSNVLGERIQVTRKKAVTTAVSRSDANIRKTMSALRPNQTIWLYNNVRYLQALMDGHSEQAPRGYMVDLSIQETRLYLALRRG